MNIKINLVTCLMPLGMLLTLQPVVGQALEKNNINCDKHQIYCHILKNKPNINKSYAMRLSNVIYKKSKIHNVNPFIFSAIIAQESYYRLDAINCIRGLITEYKVVKSGGTTDFDKSQERLKEIKICTDFGLSQIHYRTVKRYNFEIEKLTTDLNYAVEAGMIVLKDFQKMYAEKEFYWWTRYNSSTPVKREIYRQMVDRFL